MKTFNTVSFWKCLLLFALLTGCNEKVRHQSQLLIKNELATPIEITIHPKASLELLGGYKSSLTGKGGTFSKQFTLSEGREQEIFYETKHGVRPAELATSVFDSITIVADKTILRFRPGPTTGYQFGPFEKNENWAFEKLEFNAQTQFKRNPVKSENFYFVIREENVIR